MVGGIICLVKTVLRTGNMGMASMWFTRYTYIVTLLLLLFVLVWFSIQGWFIIHTSPTLDYFYNPSLKMYEPIQAPSLIQSFGFWAYGMIPWIALFNIPLVWLVFALLFFGWCIFLWVYRPDFP